jgi:PDZ domain/Tetratricopeptide repeat
VAVVLNNLASLYRGTGRSAEAEPLYRRSLLIFKASFGEDDARSKNVQEALDALASGQTLQTAVVRVLPNSPAAQIGLQSGDIIESYDGERIVHKSSFLAAVRRPGDSPRDLIIRRDGQTIHYTVAPGRLGVEIRETAANTGAAAEALRGPSAEAEGQVSGEHCVVAGREINARAVIVKYGLTEQEVLALVRETREKEGPLTDKIAGLAQKLGVTESVVQNFLRILGEKQVQPERLLENLADIAERHINMVQRLAILQPQDPATQRLVQDACSAIKGGDYDRADRLLKQAETAELAAVGMAEELASQAQEAADQRRLNAAAILAERGELSLTRLNYLDAAQHFKAASDRVPGADLKARAKYLNRYANALYEHGDKKGDNAVHNAVLRQAIDVYHKTLQELPRKRVPLDWANTQSNLGLALATLGERGAAGGGG